VTAPLWALPMDDGARLEVYAGPRRGTFRVRVVVPHPDYLGPDVVAERTTTRERFRRLWLAVQ
jgi:hypothetical protein